MTKEQNEIIALTTLSFFGGVVLTIVMANVFHREELLKQEENAFKNQGRTFIWNDDWESIPQDGATIRIEHTDGDTIYIGPSEEHDPTQYQFFTIDDSVKVYDYSRYVGTIKLDGALKTLIDRDNQ
jgi:hypothetical protein